MILRKVSNFANSYRLHDYIAAGFDYAHVEDQFPDMITCGAYTGKSGSMRSSIHHKRYMDRRERHAALLNRDESAVLHTIAKIFSGKRALQIGARQGWSSMQIAKAGVAHLDIIDPLLEARAFRDDVDRLFPKDWSAPRVEVHANVNRQGVRDLAAAGAAWAFVFIQGDHEDPSTIEGAAACHPAMANDAAILLHGLASPEVATGLDYLMAVGWNTRVIHTAQIMGLAWRGTVQVPRHVPDWRERWDLPYHLLSYKDGFKDRPDAASSWMREREFWSIWHKCRPCTMTSVERAYGLYKAIGYLSENGIPGDIVECGVWRGGSSMIAMEALRARGAQDRAVWLYDTFNGMTDPSEVDVDITGKRAADLLASDTQEALHVLCKASLEDVKANVELTGYPSDRVRFVAGDVRKTLRDVNIPEQIALLRLDTDFYDSTLLELEMLYPRLIPGGILFIDDYGYWEGSRRAVDEYFDKLRENGEMTPLLNAVDYTGRAAVKPHR